MHNTTVTQPPTPEGGSPAPSPAETGGSPAKSVDTGDDGAVIPAALWFVISLAILLGLVRLRRKAEA